ncbi:MAG TPA: ribosomal protein L7/L12 [Planctomycetaceae bacterium]|nr:ribosomal protein L7/L12 [Planctomycetaceae bacterium]
MDVPYDVMLSGLAVGMLFVVLLQLGGLQKRLAKLHLIENKVDLLLDHAGIEYDPFTKLSEDILRALQAGKKIEAIKLYREATGVGLKEAKEFIELAQLHRVTKV